VLPKMEKAARTRASCRWSWIRCGDADVKKYSCRSLSSCPSGVESLGYPFRLPTTTRRRSIISAGALGMVIGQNVSLDDLTGFIKSKFEDGDHHITTSKY